MGVYARLTGVVVLGAVILATTVVAVRSQDYASLLGHHPHHSGPDPYISAVDQRDRNCCHSADCVQFHGEVEKVAGGYRFGPWFVRDDQIIKPMTLDRLVRGHYHICFVGGRASAVRFGGEAAIRCGYFPESGV